MFILYVLLIITVCLYYYFTRTFKYWKNKNVNGPKPIPFFGNYAKVALRRKSLQQFYSDVYKEYPDEKVVGVYRMTSPALLIRDLDIAKQVLVKDFKSFPDRGTYFSKSKLGDSLFHSDAKSWNFLKPHFTSLFTPSKCKNRFHLLLKKGDEFVNYVQKVCEISPEQDVYQLLLKYTGPTVMSSFFDIDINVFNDKTSIFDALDDVMAKLSHLNELDMLFPGIMKNNNLGLFPNKVVQFCQAIVEKGKTLPDVTKSDKQSLMNIMMDLRKKQKLFNTKVLGNSDGTQESFPVTDDVLAGQAFIFYIAGYSNNNLLLCYTMFYLAKRPEIQAKLIAEIDTVVKKHNGFTYDALLEMKYLNAVFEETLRMHPLTNALVRSATEDMKIEGTDLTINKGTTMLVSAHGIQHDPKYYPDPETFSPERFLDNKIEDQNQLAFLSFGAGPRKCLGIKFAHLQYGVCIVSILLKFLITTTDKTVKDIEFDPYHLLSAPKKVHLKFLPR